MGKISNHTLILVLKTPICKDEICIYFYIKFELFSHFPRCSGYSKINYVNQCRKEKETPKLI